MDVSSGGDPAGVVPMAIPEKRDSPGVIEVPIQPNYSKPTVPIVSPPTVPTEPTARPTVPQADPAYLERAALEKRFTRYTKYAGELDRIELELNRKLDRSIDRYFQMKQMMVDVQRDYHRLISALGQKSSGPRVDEAAVSES